MDKDNHFDKLRQECWNDALHTFGTGYIYSERAINLKWYLRSISFLGILIPILLGGLVVAYGTKSAALGWGLVITSPFGIAQLVLSAWSINSSWNDLYSSYLESSLENSILAREYETLAKYPPSEFEELKQEKEKIDIKKANRDKEDNKNPLSEKERRKGMRWALRNYKRSCAGCNEVPKSMESTNCDVCGKF
ncbi:mobilome CxxCx(11)CxxC protein [Aureispira sp. CCB-QB1]|uniref:mobilome CxxCx(11)CxxC protein n=1 Tax=Aureispira sp. CCB-QB1 TaxID=1313421 RepID=UPI000695A68E|nr:mobilome CxxCx(11)CxxC protein [Aureispira sp. CCB-QB1]